MAAAKWKSFPHPAKAFAYPGEALKKNWDRLHRGDCEPFRRTRQSRRRGGISTRASSPRRSPRASPRAGRESPPPTRPRTIYANGVETRMPRASRSSRR
jgi:hypothetical protein